MKLNKIFLSLILVLVVITAMAQNTSIILRGGTAHIGNGTVIENSLIRIEKGVITYVGKDDNSSANGATELKITGKHVYPGLIAPNTIIGLSEIEAVRSTQDNSEVGYYNPNVRSIIAYNTDSKIIGTLRSNGILLAEITPRAGIISGSSSVLTMDGWNWEDAAYKTDIGIHLNWPGIYRRTGWWGEPGPTELNKNYDKVVDEIKAFIAEAKGYSLKQGEKTINLKFDAMKGLFDRSKKLFIHVGSAREIMAVIDFNKQYNFDLVLVGADEVLQVADLLKENKIPVILNNIHSLPNRTEDDPNLPYKTPYLLKQAGVDFCLSIGGSWQERNLAFLAGTASAFGLSKEDALASITSNAARILGIDKTTGTIETGKDATLLISTGDLLDMRTSNVEYAYIKGRSIDLNNMQKDLYNKFQTKYNEQKK